MAEILRFTVPESFGGKPAKWFLKDFCSLSTRMITLLKRENEGIMMNGKKLRTVDPVTAGAEVVIRLPEEAPSFIEPVSGETDVVFEDEFLLVVNKPPQMPVHPVKQHQTDTLANRVAFYAGSKGESYVFRALGTVSAPIGLREDSKMVRRVLKEGAPAITHYTAIYSSKEFSYIKCVLETGKTHQIRCHMAHLGHPLLGDDLYGGTREQIARQALHCGEMIFRHPVSDEETALTAPLPEDMAKLLKNNEKKP